MLNPMKIKKVKNRKKKKEIRNFCEVNDEE